MDKKIKKAGNNETSRQGINQFIIECMFSKYFEEEKVNAKQGEIASSLPLASLGTSRASQ